jgi:ribosomal protein S18 acetylase RimI-like enzyme
MKYYWRLHRSNFAHLLSSLFKDLIQHGEEVIMPVRVYAGFDELPESYEKFFREIGRDNFFLSLGWFRNLASAAMEPNAELRLYAVERDDSEATPLALLVTRAPAGQNGSIFNGRWIGRRSLSAMTNYQSIEFAPLISPDLKDPSIPLRELIAYICAERPRWSLIDFNLLDSQAPWFKPLCDSFAAAGMVAQSYFYAGRRFEPTEGLSFQDYIANRPNNERRGIRRHKRQLEEKHRVRLEIVTGPESLDDAIADYDRVLAASWKEPEMFPTFTAGLIRAAAESQALRLGLLYVNDEPVATQIWIVAGGRATIYKLHFHEGYRRYSVGSILTAHLMERALEVDKVREVDFGLFDSQSKRAWMTKLREVHGLVAFNPRVGWGAVALMRFEIGRVGSSLLEMAKPALKPVYAMIRRLATSPKFSRP